MSTAASRPAVVRNYAPWLARTERHLGRAVADHPANVADPADATLRAGGKRVRPLLVFCCAPTAARREDAPGRALVVAAAAVELVHMATLVHDDLIDGATLRRGRPTIAATLGAQPAIATGDFLFARAFGELAATGHNAAVARLATAALDLSLGELDQQREAHDLELDEGAYLARARRKTAALFAVACRLGAMVGGADAAAQERLASFGESVGMAFQIFDDILDLAGSPDRTGKRLGTDLRDGTVTLPVILAMAEEPELRHRIAAARTDRDYEDLCSHLASHPGLVTARRRALDHVAAARAVIQEGPTGGADIAALAEIADGVVDRYS